MAPDHKLQRTIQILTKDSESMYDECTVDSLITKLTKVPRNLLESLMSGILVELYTSPEYRNFNLTRILKFHQAIPLHIGVGEALWRRLPQIIEKDNPSHIAAALLILKSLSNDKDGYLWLMDKKFNRTIRLTHNTSHIEIEDAVTISRYYMEITKNYHIQNYAKKLLVSLLRQSCKFRIIPLHRIVVSGKKVVEDLLRLRSPAMCQAIIEIVEDVYIYTQLMERYDILTQVRQYFFESVKNDSRDIIPIAKCYASVSVQSELRQAVDALRNKNDYEAIIAYVTNIHEELLPQAHMMYIVYPILSKCDSEDAQVLIPNLFITREDQNFLDRHMQDKFVLLCISYMSKVIKKQSWTSVWSTLTQQRFIYYLDVLTEYVKCNCTLQKAYKNVMECCHVLRGIDSSMKRRGREIGWLWGLIDICLETIRKLNDKLKHISENQTSNNENPGHFTSVMMELIQVVSVAHYIASTHHGHPKNDQNMVKIVELANEFHDSEILNGFAELFNSNQVLQLGEGIPDKGEKFISLVWNRMYLNGLEKDDQDLIGNAAKLLILIDTYADALTLGKVGLRRYHHIPQALGDILINYSTVPCIVEKIIPFLRDRAVRNPCKSPSKPFNYLRDLDRGCLPDTVRTNLDHLIKGLCVTVKGESDSDTRKEALKLLNFIIEEFMLNNDNELYLIERLVKTRILETLYEISTGTLYSDSFYSLASKKLTSIRNNIVKKRTDFIVELIRKDDPDDEWRRQRAQNVADFYSSDSKFKRDTTSIVKDSNMTLTSYMDDVIDGRISDRISECY